MSVISVSVATRGSTLRLSSRLISSITINWLGSANGDRQPPVRQLLERNEVEAEHQLDRHFPEELMLNLESLKLNTFAAITARQFVRALLLIVRVWDRFYKKLL